MPLRSRTLFDAVVLSLCLILGVTIVLASQWFSEHAIVEDRFPLKFLGLNSREWAFGRREYVHLAGFIGCFLFGWSFIESFRFKLARYAHACLAGLAVLWTGLNYLPPDSIPESLYHSYGREVIAIGFYGGLILVLLWLDKKRTTPVYPLGSLLFVTAAATTVSLGWELICQPFFSINRAPDRTGVDWAQVIFDVISIGTGFALTYGVLRTLEWREAARKSGNCSIHGNRTSSP